MDQGTKATESIVNYKKNVVVFKQLAQKIGTSADTPEHRQFIAHQTDAINELSSRIKRQLTELLRASETDGNLKKLHSRLNRDFERLKDDYEKLQSNAQAKQNEHAPITSPEFVPYKEDPSEGASGMNQAQLQGQMVHNGAIIEERVEAIQGIQKDVQQVNEMFKDLAKIVNDQATDIDDIETQISESHSQAKKGLEEVQKAAEYQPKCVIS